MRITYVLPRPELGGGNKVVFQHAELLRSRGHEVTLLGEGAPPDWNRFRARYLDYSESIPNLPSQDLVISTFWITIALARKLNLGPCAHFCQGYEGGHQHFQPQIPEIEAAYGLPGRGLVVTPYLKDLLERRFDKPCHVVPPPLDRRFRHRLRRSPRRRPWVAVPGVFEAKVKGVPTALKAIQRLRDLGLRCRVLRFSTLPLSDEERALLEPDRYLHGVHPAEIARIVPTCDLLMMPSEVEEGFGLPMLEAMACKVPVVASRIPSTEYMASSRAHLVPVGDVEAFVERSYRLLTDPKAWRRTRRREYDAAQRFSPDRVAKVLDQAVNWAAKPVCAVNTGAVTEDRNHVTTPAPRSEEA